MKTSAIESFFGKVASIESSALPQKESIAGAFLWVFAKFFGISILNDFVCFFAGSYIAIAIYNTVLVFLSLSLNMYC